MTHRYRSFIHERKRTLPKCMAGICPRLVEEVAELGVDLDECAALAKERRISIVDAALILALQTRTVH